LPARRIRSGDAGQMRLMAEKLPGTAQKTKNRPNTNVY
jgi:hypothetical protein